jgi:hypothetical protein
VKLGRWHEAVEPWLEGGALLQDTGIEWEQIAAMSVAVSPLYAAGDIEGAAPAWAMAKALAGERDIRIQPLDIDEDALAGIRAHSDDVTETIVRPDKGRSLGDAMDSVKASVRALTSERQPGPGPHRTSAQPSG